MRCFIAISLPDGIKEKVSGFRVDERIARVTYPPDYHLTLRFLGDIAEEEIDKVKSALRNVDYPRFSLSLDNIDFFIEKDKSPSIVWIGVNPKDKVIGLRRKIDDALAPTFEPEERYNPHVTLCRIKRIKNDRIWNYSRMILEGRFNVDGFELFRNDLIGERHLR